VTPGPRRTPIPLQLFALDAAGCVLTGVGIGGLVTDLSGFLPFLADQNTAGAIAGAGVALMTFALFRIVQHLRAQRQQQ
jgi:hypothetical protein